MLVFPRAFVAAFISACLIGETTPTLSLAATRFPTVPVVFGTKTFSGRKVDLRSLAVRVPAPRAVRQTYPHVKSLVKAPEPARLPPHLIHHDADPLAIKLFHDQGGTRRVHGASGARALSSPGGRRTSSGTGNGPGTTGHYPWWTFESHSAFGAMGQALVNVANGNLLLGGTDVSVPHFGLDLVVSRAYNSTSQYDVNNTDGSQPSLFGNGWTSNLDAHLALSAAGGIAIYDGLGTRWDFSPNADGGWIPPAGNHSSLWYNASNQEYYWTFKDGMVYQFRSPTCSTAAVCGRVHYIYARNNNEYLHFTYGFSQQSLAFESMASIEVSTEAGLELYCFMNPINGHPLVTQIEPHNLNTGAWPPGTSYTYDNAGNLISYTGVSNNDAGATPTVGYVYNSGGYQLQQVTSPLYANGHGAYIQFVYASNRVSEVDYYGEVNPTVPDGVSSGPIQSGSSGVVRYNATQYAYNYYGAWTNVTDTDGHQRGYLPNADGSVASRATWIGGSSYLRDFKNWDTNHNVLYTTDARGGRTDYEYDAQGNLVTEALPSVAAYAGGSHSTTTMRPTTRTVYDAFNNVVAICGAAWNHAHGSDFGGTNSCAAGAAGVTSFSYQWSDVEANGRLNAMTDPAGYHYTWSYDQTAQGGTDYSLPTEIAGDYVNQPNSPGSGSIRPDQKMSYDVYGNLICYNDGIGVTAFVYDAMNRLTEKHDPDDSLPACGRTPGAYQTALIKAYYANGQIRSMGTSFTHSLNNDQLFTYDLDGNTASSTDYENSRANVTKNFYDGADRLIEVLLPHTTDSDAVPDAYPAPWITRYIFDNSGGMLQSEPGISGTFSAFGNLFKLQEYQGSVFVDLKVTAYDPDNRELSSYSHIPGQPVNVWRSQSNTYDTAAAGRTASTSDSGGNSETLAYDAQGRVAAVQFTSSGTATPSRTYGYDEEGRVVLTRSGTWGDEWQTYDPYTGRLLSRTEPNGGGLTSAGTFSYAYFANGANRSTSFNGAAFNGEINDQWYNINGTLAGKNLYNGSGTLLSTFTATYTPGQRVLTQSDSSASNARTVSLDGYGRPQSVGMPAGSYSAIGYDVDGNITGFNAMSGHNVLNIFNGRSELTRSAWMKGGVPDKTYPNMQQHGANGQATHDSYGCDTSTTPQNCFWQSDNDTVDALSAVVMNSDPIDPSGSYDFPASYQYDAIGRLQSNTETFLHTNGRVPTTYSGTATKTYDAENRLTSDTYVNWSPPTSTVCSAKSTASSPAPQFT